jgi:hypothetical protein
MRHTTTRSLRWFLIGVLGVLIHPTLDTPANTTRSVLAITIAAYLLSDPHLNKGGGQHPPPPPTTPPTPPPTTPDTNTTGPNTKGGHQHQGTGATSRG